MEIIDGKEYINQKEAMMCHELTREEIIDSLGEGIYSRQPAYQDRGKGWDGDIRQKLYPKDLILKLKEEKIKNGRKGSEALRILVKRCKDMFIKEFKVNPTGIKQFKEGNFNFISLYNKENTKQIGLYSQKYDGDILVHDIKNHYIENIVNLSGKASEMTDFFFSDLI